MSATVCLCAKTLHYLEGGGHLWVYLNWALGLRDNGWTFLLSLPHTVRTLQLGLYDVEGRAGPPAEQLSAPLTLALRRLRERGLEVLRPGHHHLPG